MDLVQSMGGMLELTLTSPGIETALEAINARGIPLLAVTRSDTLTVRFRIRRWDYRALAALCEKRGEKLEIRRRMGVYWAAKRLFARPVLLMGAALFLAAALYLPSRIFFVRVEGCQTVPARQILEAAEESGIRFGASRREVRSEKVKNALLGALPQLQWAGVNTSGCVATISVRERTMLEPTEPTPAVSSIVASRDGFILSATVTRGNGLCQPGQAVREGQVLISGYTDCGIRIQATAAEGEIFAQTSRNLTAVTPSTCAILGEETGAGKNICLILGKKRINLWKDSGILEGSCGRMDKEYTLTLPGGFSLPVKLRVQTYTRRETACAEVPPETARGALSGFAGDYLASRMVAGQILAGQESVRLQNGVYRLEGNYVCAEMIGRVRTEQIGDIHGKSG